MPQLIPILEAAITGFSAGFLLSIPVGPVNLTVINEGARRGFRFAALVGLGAVTMEVTYCAIAFTAFADLFTRPWVRTLMTIFSALFLIFLGLKFLALKKVPAVTPAAGSFQAKHPPKSAFMTGWVRVLANPGVLGLWIVLSSTFISHEWVAPIWPCKSACVAGVALGIGLWFLGLSYAVSLGHKKFSEAALLRVERWSGIGLIGLGAAQGLSLVWKWWAAHGALH